jgi:hypothetical protein
VEVPYRMTQQQLQAVQMSFKVAMHEFRESAFPFIYIIKRRNFF